MTDEPKKIPIRSRVMFSGAFSAAGRPFDPSSPRATVLVAGSLMTFDRMSGLVRDGEGLYHVEMNLDKPGPVTVTFETGDGSSVEETYVVTSSSSPSEAAPAQRAKPPGIVWPAGYDRARAIAEFQIDAAGKSDAFVFGVLRQYLQAARARSLVGHDDRQRLPEPDDETRARRLAASRLPGKDSIEQARGDVRRELLGRQ